MKATPASETYYRRICQEPECGKEEFIPHLRHPAPYYRQLCDQHRLAKMRQIAKGIETFTYKRNNFATNPPQHVLNARIQKLEAMVQRLYDELGLSDQ